ncbi:MAG: hypothetical protein ACRDF9_09345 [Candidatus Limnocylindria bacterium]
MPARRIEIALAESPDGWVANVTVTAPTRTAHVVRVSHAEHERYGDGDVKDLVRRSFEFLLDRESNTSILREFDLGTIERYFPEYATTIKRT